MFEYYTIADSEQIRFYQLPKELVKNKQFKGMSDSSKILYSLVRDRVSLSVKNNWVDKLGRVYIIYTLAEIMEDLGCANQKATKSMKELQKIGLVDIVCRGLGRPNIIYVKNFATGLKSTGESHETPIIPQTHENHDSGLMKIMNQDSLKSRISTPENHEQSIRTLSNTNLSDTESKSTSDAPEKVIHNQGNDNDVDNDYELSLPKKDKEKEPTVSTAVQSKETRSSTKNLITRFDEHDYNTYRKKLQENIEYSHFLQYSRQDISLIDELVDCMLDVIFTEGDTVKINGENKNRQMVINQYLKINPADIELILAKYKEQQHKITHIHNYLKTILYNVKQEQGHHYTNAVTGYMEKMAMQAANEVNETENL